MILKSVPEFWKHFFNCNFLSKFYYMKKLLLLLIIVAFSTNTFSQKKQSTGYIDDSLLFSKVKYRSVGPYRGGRSGAVVGDLNQKNVFYFGATDTQPILPPKYLSVIFFQLLPPSSVFHTPPPVAPK